MIPEDRLVLYPTEVKKNKPQTLHHIIALAVKADKKLWGIFTAWEFFFLFKSQLDLDLSLPLLTQPREEGVTAFLMTQHVASLLGLKEC